MLLSSTVKKIEAARQKAIAKIENFSLCFRPEKFKVEYNKVSTRDELVKNLES